MPVSPQKLPCTCLPSGRWAINCRPPAADSRFTETRQHDGQHWSVNFLNESRTREAKESKVESATSYSTYRSKAASIHICSLAPRKSPWSFLQASVHPLL